MLSSWCTTHGIGPLAVRHHLLSPAPPCLPYIAPSRHHDKHQKILYIDSTLLPPTFPHLKFYFMLHHWACTMHSCLNRHLKRNNLRYIIYYLHKSPNVQWENILYMLSLKASAAYLCAYIPLARNRWTCYRWSATRPAATSSAWLSVMHLWALRLSSNKTDATSIKRLPHDSIINGLRELKAFS